MAGGHGAKRTPRLIQQRRTLTNKTQMAMAFRIHTMHRSAPNPGTSSCST
jgi:hypothetical protein